MNYLTIIILIFSVLGAVDKMFGNRLGLGEEFEKAFNLLGVMALSMIGMIVISPLFAELIEPLSKVFSSVLKIDASVIPALLFANDMGGAPLAVELAVNKELGMYNALVVSSMMGCTVSFTIPYALGVVKKEIHNDLLLGLLSGIVTIPVGCIVSGIISKIPIIPLILNIIPLLILSVIIALGLIYFPEKCIKAFKVFGVFITVIITVGLSMGVINFLLGYDFIKGIGKIEDGMSVCMNAAIVLSGSFPFMLVLSKLLSKPLKWVGKKRGLNELSVIGFIATLATSATAFGLLDRMDRKGAVMNSAFAVSGAFVLGSHLAFTLAFDSSFVLPVITGKLVSGILAIIVADINFHKIAKSGKSLEK